MSYGVDPWQLPACCILRGPNPEGCLAGRPAGGAATKFELVINLRRRSRSTSRCRPGRTRPGDDKVIQVTKQRWPGLN